MDERQLQSLKDRAQALAVTLGSVGWTEIIAYEIAEKYAETVGELLKLKREGNDDYLRGQVAAYNWVLSTFPKRLQELQTEIAAQGDAAPEIGIRPPV